MAPVVHGLAKQYAGRVDFLYLDIADPRNADAADRLAFKATPHFFLLSADGAVATQMRGVIPRDTLVRALDQLLAVGVR